jgi:hypothetical protein
MNHYNNKERLKGSFKQKARKVMVKAIHDSETSKGMILTLPFEKCMIEKMILNKTKRYSFMGCEIDRKTYKNMVKTIIKDDLLDYFSMHRGFLSEMIYGKGKDAYSHIIADYCGQLHKQAKELSYAIKNNIVEVNGTISITLCERIHPTGLRFEKNITKDHPKRGKITRCEHQLRCFIKSVAGNNYEIETVMRYKDTAQMILMIVRRVK